METSSDVVDMKMKEKEISTKSLYFILDEFTSGGCYDYHEDGKLQGVQYTIHKFDLDSEIPFNSETPRRPIPEPLLRLPSHTFPMAMGFAVLGSKLYMVGGTTFDSDLQVLGFPRTLIPTKQAGASNRVFIIDTSLFSRSLDDDYEKYVVEGPGLACAKVDPVVIPVGDRLYVFARCMFPEDQMAIEFLDTDKEDSCWSLVFPPPPLPSRSFFPKHYKNFNDSEDEDNPYRILSYTVAGSRIYLSLRMSLLFNAGVFIFDTESSTWQVVDNKSDDNLPPFYWNGFFWDEQGLWFKSRTTDGTVVVQDSTGQQKIIHIPRLFSPDLQSHILEVDRDRGLVLAFSWYLPGCNYCSSLALGTFLVVDIQLLRISCGGTAAAIESSGGKRKRDSSSPDDAYGCFCELRTEFVSKKSSMFDHNDIPICFLK